MQIKAFTLFLVQEKALFFLGFVSIIAGILVTKFFQYLSQQKILSKTERKVAHMRFKDQSQNGLRVRQTDLVDKMSRQAKTVHKQAEELERQGRHLEAATLFESINFQRRAIDILEQNGFIEQACEILERLGSHNRAAIVCERNQKFELAAKYYIDAKHFDKAGHALLRIAHTDYHFYEKAAECYEHGHHVQGLLNCWGPLLKSNKILKLCLEKSNFEFLVFYMKDPVNARSIIAQLNDDQLKSLFDQIPLSPQMVQTVINWVYYVSDQRLYRKALKFAGQDIFMCRLFWQMASKHLSEGLYAELIAIHPDLESANLKNHTHFFETSGQFSRAAEMSLNLHDHLRAANNWLRASHIKNAKDVLQDTDCVSLVAKLSEILEENPEGPWSIDQLERAKYYIESDVSMNLPQDLSKAPPKNVSKRAS